MKNEIFYLELTGSFSSQIKALNFFDLQGITLEINQMQILIPIFSKDEGTRRLKKWKSNHKKNGTPPIKIFLDQEYNCLYFQDLKISITKKIETLILKKAI